MVTVFMVVVKENNEYYVCDISNSTNKLVKVDKESIKNSIAIQAHKHSYAGVIVNAKVDTKGRLIITDNIDNNSPIRKEYINKLSSVVDFKYWRYLSLNEIKNMYDAYNKNCDKHASDESELFNFKKEIDEYIDNIYKIIEYLKSDNVDFNNFIKILRYTENSTKILRTILNKLIHYSNHYKYLYSDKAIHVKLDNEAVISVGVNTNKKTPKLKKLINQTNSLLKLYDRFILNTYALKHYKKFTFDKVKPLLLRNKIMNNIFKNNEEQFNFIVKYFLASFLVMGHGELIDKALTDDKEMIKLLNKFSSCLGEAVAQYTSLGDNFIDFAVENKNIMDKILASTTDKDTVECSEYLKENKVVDTIKKADTKNIFSIAMKNVSKYEVAFVYKEVHNIVLCDEVFETQSKINVFLYNKKNKSVRLYDYTRDIFETGIEKINRLDGTIHYEFANCKDKKLVDIKELLDTIAADYKYFVRTGVADPNHPLYIKE